MLVGIISDSHDHLDNINKAVGLINSKNIDFLIHCGDIVSPFSANLLNDLNCEYAGVFGNNDGDWQAINKFTKNRFNKGPMKVDRDGKKIIIFHEPFIISDISLNIDIILYGHTHHKDLRKKGTQLILNPGTLAGYSSMESTISILDTKTMDAEFISI